MAEQLSSPDSHIVTGQSDGHSYISRTCGCIGSGTPPLWEDFHMKWNPQVTNKENLTKDFLASIVVFLTALPLCMGIALASGAPVEAGLITGIIGGLIVGWFTGSPLQVSGPAAGLTVLVFEIITKYGFKSLSVILLVAGILQIAMGYFKIGQIFRAVSPAVINGMLSGIGMMLIFSQLYIMSDFTPRENGLNNFLGLQKLFADIFVPNSPHLSAFVLGCAAIGILVAWKKFAKGPLATIPAALVAVGTCTVIATIAQLPVHYVQVPDSLFTAISLPDFGTISHLRPWNIARFSMALAIIASAETLLSAAAVDKMHTGPRTRYNKELTAQGIGNVLCSLVGALPMTGVIARSSVNVQSGAKSRLSAIMHGLWLFIAVMALPSILRLVPIASLAALLCYTGFKLIDKNEIKKLWDYGPRLVAIYALTVVAIVTTDLLMGVLLGVVLSIAKLVYTMARLHCTVERDGPKTLLHLRGAATFISLPVLANALEEVPPNTELHVCFDELDYVDHACLELIMDWEKQHETTGGSLVLDWGELRAMFRHKRRTQSQRQRHLNPIGPPKPSMNFDPEAMVDTSEYSIASK